MARNPAVDAGANPEPRAEELLPFDRDEIDAVALELDAAGAALVVFAAETGLRTNEWTATERRDLDRSGSPAVQVERRHADGVLTPYPKTAGSRRRVPLTSRALEALEPLPPRLDTPLLFPAAGGGHIGLDNWRTRVWYPALEAAGVSIFELARLMGASVRVIDKTYGHHARDSEAAIRARLEARSERSGVVVASDPDA